jgi:hypothetical protein
VKGLAIGALALALAAPALAAQGEAAKDPALVELIEILRERGVLEAGDEEAIEQAAAEDPAWFEKLARRIDLWGDFRGRYEYFSYFDDPVDAHRELGDRHRLRYRLRLNLKGRVNDYAEAFVRVTPGNDNRTTNQTFGDGVDFAKSEVFLDKVYVRASPYAGGALPGGDGTLWGYFGRTQQPWRWGIYKDWIWDDEISPTGLYLQGDKRLGEGFEVFGNAGFYIIDENGNDKDPSLAAGTLGFHGKRMAEGGDDHRLDYGGKLNVFNFFNLDRAFIQRGVDSSTISSPTFAAGNTLGGLTGDATGGHTTVLEVGSYVTLFPIADWPLSIYGNFSYNFGAEKVTVVNPATSAVFSPPLVVAGSFRADREPIFWVVGADFGDKKKNVKLRMQYTWMEANAFPAQFIDSDLHDAISNRKGFVWAATRSVMENVDVALTALLSDSIKDGSAYQNSLAGSDRFRLQANFVLSF